MYLLDENGQPIDSELSFEADQEFTSVVVESSGGASPQAGIVRRNPEYNRLLNALLTRLSELGVAITRIILESKTVAELPLEKRTATLDREYPS